MGRYESPDWANKAEPVPYAKLDNPQTLNLYGYVANNPESRVDPDGHLMTIYQLYSWHRRVAQVLGYEFHHKEWVPQVPGVGTWETTRLNPPESSARIPWGDDLRAGGPGLGV